MPARRKKPTYEDYSDWMVTKLGTSVGPREETHYAITSQLIEQQILQSPFWSRLVNDLPEAQSEYLTSHGYPLFPAGQDAPTLERKQWHRFRHKTYRRNIQDNVRWPRQPLRGWVTFPGWYTQIGDIVRTMLVVRYLDGLDFLAGRITALARSNDLRPSVNPVATIEGYYATHIDVTGTLSLPDREWDTLSADVSIEIQVTTQLQDNVRQLLHRNYEVARTTEEIRNWQWDYQSRAFRANYLGHVLHYLEGMVMAVREERDGE